MSPGWTHWPRPQIISAPLRLAQSLRQPPVICLVLHLLQCTHVSTILDSHSSFERPAKQHLHISAIVGAIIGAIGSIILFAVTLSFCYRRLRDTARLNGTEAQDVFRATPPTLPPTSCPIALPSTRPSTQFNYPCHDFTSGAASSDVVATTSQLLSINEDSPPPAYSQILPSRYTPLAVS